MIYVKLIEQNDNIDWNKIAKLYIAVGWEERNLIQLRRAYEKSLVCIAYDSDNIVGVGRAITDFEYYANIYDVIVLPEYQSMGIGKKIMDSLTEQLKDMKFIHLTSVPTKEGFYKKLGFKKQTTAFVKMKDENSPYAAQITELES